jgi:tryptophan synthase alpha chain
MSRIACRFQTLRRAGRTALIPYVTAGDPQPNITVPLLHALVAAGADIIELGVPFSDPLADGPTIQAASQRALEQGTTLAKILRTVKRIRRRSQIPIALMTYYNPIFKFGEKRFIAEAERCGVDGVIIPDLPPEEASVLRHAAKKAHIATVFFLAPTTTVSRMKRIVNAATGFVYYVSMTGVTGSKKGFARENAAKIRTAKRLTKKPVCVGFGISSAADVRAVARMADGVIVGSAIVKEINRNKGKRDLVRNVTRFVRSLMRGL